MIRLIGILTGSALAIAFLIVALGVPELGSQESETDATTPARDPVAVEAPEPVPAAQAIEPPPAPPMDAAPAVPAAADTAIEPAAPAAPAPPTPEPSNVPVDETVPASPAEEQHWYAFWSPFRSRIAAEGFVAELQRTTGLDFRVVKQKPGVYEVAFAYSGDGDIQDKLSRISAATGLDMTGG